MKDSFRNFDELSDVSLGDGGDCTQVSNRIESMTNRFRDLAARNILV